MTSPTSESIVITGCGWVTPFAAGTIREILEAAAAGSAPTSQADSWAVSGSLLDDYPDLSDELKANKGTQVAAIAVEHARQQANLQSDPPQSERVGLVLGCSLAGQLGMIDFANEVREQSARFVTPLHFPTTVGNYIAGALARSYGIRGPNITLASGSASGLDAIIEGSDLIARGDADVVFAGGVDTLSPELALGLAEPGVLLSEGACMFVLQREEHASATGTATLATIQQPDSSAAQNVASADTTDAILASATCRRPGAIFIEHWIGRCPGPAGPAAAAAAIGAVGQAHVPIVDPTNPASIDVKPVAIDRSNAAQATVPAVIFADTNGAHQRTLRLSIPGT